MVLVAVAVVILVEGIRGAVVDLGAHVTECLCMLSLDFGRLDGVGLALLYMGYLGSSKSKTTCSCFGVVCTVVVRCCRCMRNNRVVIVRGPVVL